MEKVKTGNIEHGLLEQLANSVQHHDWKNLKADQRKEKLEREKRDNELIEMEYVNLKDQQNGKWEGQYIGGPGKPIQLWRMLHGHRYKIPRGLARKIKALGAPVRSGIVSVQGEPTPIEGSWSRTHDVIPVMEL